MSDVILKAHVPPKKPYQISAGSEVLMRVEEFLVETPENFDIVSLCIGSEVVIGERVPAEAFSKDALIRDIMPTVLQPWPGMSVTLLIENDSDEYREFKAVLKGRTK